MDSIDITDSAFSLGFPDVNDVVSSSGAINDYTMFIYIGAIIVVAFISMFIYKFYINKNKNNYNEDSNCSGGFCTMNTGNPSTSYI